MDKLNNKHIYRIMPILPIQELSNNLNSNSFYDCNKTKKKVSIGTNFKQIFDDLMKESI